MMKSLHGQKPDTNVRAADKRRWPRLNVKLPVRLSLDLGSTHTEYKHALTENISAGGVLLRCFGLDREIVGRLIREESELCLYIRLQEDGDPLPASGQVLRAVESGGDMLLVVRFIALEPAERDRIHEFMLPHYPGLIG